MAEVRLREPIDLLAFLDALLNGFTMGEWRCLEELVLKRSRGWFEQIQRVRSQGQASFGARLLPGASDVLSNGCPNLSLCSALCLSSDETPKPKRAEPSG